MDELLTGGHLEPDAAAEGEEYWHLARQPLHALMFLLPFLALYEAGVYFAGNGSAACRGGADCLLRSVMAQGGLNQWWAPSALVVSLLLAWQFVGGYRWCLSPAALCGMLAESLFYALALVVLGQVQDLALQQLEAAWVVAAMKQTQLETLGRAVGFVGAGIYEEVLFRGALLPAIYLLVRGAQLPRKAALTAAVVLSSALFAAAHYWGPQSLAPDVRGFVFRATAGVLFGVLLVLRGIGITIGAHVAYDILVGVLLQPAL